MTDSSSRRKTCAGILLIALTVFVAGCNLFICPFNANKITVDQAVFMYIGQGMRRGLLPYRDMFDHKGMLLYVINYLAAGFLPNGNWGIWIISLAIILATMLLYLKTNRLLTDSKLYRYTAAVVTTLISVNIFTANSEDINNSDGYCMLLTAVLVYIFIKCSSANKYRAGDMILLGVSFAAALMLKVNYAALWFPFIVIVLIRLIKEKDYRQIGRCIAFFLIGAGIILLPMLVYFIATDTLDDMLRCYWNFNLEYTGAAGWRKVPAVMLKEILWTGLLFAAPLSWPTNKKNRLWYEMLIAAAVGLVVTSMSGQVYRHYSMPLFAFTNYFTMMFLLSFKDKAGRLTAVALLSAAILFSIDTAISMKDTPMNAAERIEKPAVEYVIRNTEPEDDVLFIGYHITTYLNSERVTSNRFFFQFPPVAASREVRDEFLESLSDGKSDTIVLCNYTDVNDNTRIQMDVMNQIAEHLNQHPEYRRAAVIPDEQGNITGTVYIKENRTYE